jgi:SAM-dependent methyltransferase
VNAGPVRDLLWANLREIPAFRALIRTIEGRLLLENGPLPRPLLDIGCGDGHFAQVVLGAADVGIDLDFRKLRQAAGREVYRHLDAASATRLPFRDGSFQSVLANCAVEHMPDLDAVFGEVARVLRPGGTFVFTVPTDQLNRNLGLASLLDRVGARGAAERYRHWFARMQVHAHLYSPDEWQRRVESHPFKVTARRGYLSRRATHHLEAGHVLGLPNLVWQTLLGRWVVWPWRPRFALQEARLLPLVEEDDPPGASCCLFVARRTEGSARRPRETSAAERP